MPFVVMPAETLRGMAPVYMKHLIDQDKTSYYMFMFADPLKGDASRETACAFFKHVLYDILRQVSSYDIHSGYKPGPDEDPRMGTMDTDDAIDCEVLPAQTDKEYNDFYTAQLKKIKDFFGKEFAKADKQAKIDKLGFDPDDGLTIDVDVDQPADPQTGVTVSGQVGAAQQTAVGAVKKIWYAIDIHIPSGGMLGYKNENFVKSAEDMAKIVYADIGSQLGFNGINEDEEEDEKKDDKPEDAEETPAEEPETDEEPADGAEDAPAEEPETEPVEEPEDEPEGEDDDETVEGKLKAALSDIGSAMYLLRQQQQQDLEEEELDPLNESIDPFAMARWTYLSRD